MVSTMFWRRAAATVAVLAFFTISLSSFGQEVIWQTKIAIGRNPFPQRVIVENASTYYCKAFIENHVAALLAPGDRIKAVRAIQSTFETAPVWALCYSDEYYRDYAGSVEKDFTLLPEQETRGDWVITDHDLTGINGAHRTMNGALPVLEPAARELAWPERYPKVGGTFVDVFNNSPYLLIVSVDGDQWAKLAPGEIFPGWASSYYAAHHMVVQAIDESGNVAGTWGGDIPAVPWGYSQVTAVNWSFEARSFGR